MTNKFDPLLRLTDTELNAIFEEARDAEALTEEDAYEEFLDFEAQYDTLAAVQQSLPANQHTLTPIIERLFETHAEPRHFAVTITESLPAAAGDPSQFYRLLNPLIEACRTQGRLSDAATLWGMQKHLYKHFAEPADRAFRNKEWSPAKHLYTKALNFCPQFGTIYLATLDNLTSALEMLKDYNAAISNRIRLLEYPSKDLARHLTQLGESYLATGRVTEAELSFTRALQMCEESPTPDNYVTAAAANGLAAVYFDQRRYTDAEPHATQALQALDNVEDVDLVLYGNILHNLGIIYLHQGKLASADSKFIEAEPLLPQPDRYTVTINRAKLAILEGRYERAKQYLQGAIENTSAYFYCAEVSQPNAEALLVLGVLSSAMGEPKEAAERFEQVKGLYDDQAPQHRANIADTLSNLAAASNALGRHTEAETFAKEAIEIYTEALPANHTDTTAAHINLAIAVANQNRFDEAEQILGKAEESLSETFGNHPTYALVIKNLAAVYNATGRHQQAVTLNNKACSIYFSASDNPPYANAMRDVAAFVPQFAA